MPDASPSRACRSLLCTAVLLLSLLMPAPAAAQRPQDAEAELEQLASTLKAAVMSGAMSSEEATKVYFVMADRLGLGNAGKDAAKDADDGRATKRDVTLSAPSPQQIRTLFQPEFLWRDLPELRDELDLDRDQMLIVRSLFGDYMEAYDVASTPLREALTQYQRSSTDRWLVTVFERIELPDADVAAANIRRSVEEWGGTKEAEDERRSAQRGTDAAKLAQHLLDVARTMDERLASLRQRVDAELARLDGAEITADDLLRMAKQLRADRAQLRSDLTESIKAITTDQQRGNDDAVFTRAMAWIRVARGLPWGRLAGESMNLWAALAEAGERQSPGSAKYAHTEHAQSMLDDRLPTVAARVDDRAEATIAREIAGLEFRSILDQAAAANGESRFDPDQRRSSKAIRPFVDAVRRELTASVATRDALLALLDESAACIDEADGNHPHPAIMCRYRAAALRRGFPMEMQRRWSERVIAAALDLDDLDDETRDVLSRLEADIDGELQLVRNDAVARRIEREPRLARAQVDARFGDKEQQIEFNAELWLGMNFETFAAIDDRVEDQLRAMLTTEQFRSLPRRTRTGVKTSGKGIRATGDAAGEGKPAKKRR